MIDSRLALSSEARARQLARQFVRVMIDLYCASTVNEARPQQKRSGGGGRQKREARW